MAHRPKPKRPAVQFPKPKRKSVEEKIAKALRRRLGGVPEPPRRKFKMKEIR